MKVNWFINWFNSWHNPDGDIGWYNLDGNIDVKQYPSSFFRNAIRMDFLTAIRSENVREQYFTVVPRHWFIDAWFLCERCNEEFCWTAEEQKHWFDELKFYVGSIPRCCKECRQAVRLQKRLRQRYDAEITAALRMSTSPEAKKEILDMIDHLIQSFNGEIPESIQRNRRTLEKQLLKQKN